MFENVSCRETARRLRQRKAETLQNLQQEVVSLAQENSSLTKKLKDTLQAVWPSLHEAGEILHVRAHVAPHAMVGSNDGRHGEWRFPHQPHASTSVVRYASWLACGDACMCIRAWLEC